MRIKDRFRSDPFTDLLFNALLGFTFLFLVAIMFMNPEAKSGARASHAPHQMRTILLLLSKTVRCLPICCKTQYFVKGCAFFYGLEDTPTNMKSGTDTFWHSLSLSIKMTLRNYCLQPPPKEE